MSGISGRLSFLVAAFALLAVVVAPGIAGALPRGGPLVAPAALVPDAASPVAEPQPPDREVPLLIRVQDDAADPAALAGMQVGIFSSLDTACVGSPMAGPSTTDASGLVAFTVLVDRLVRPAVRVRVVDPTGNLAQHDPCALVDLSAATVSGAGERVAATMAANPCLVPAAGGTPMTESDTLDLRVSNIGVIELSYALWIRDTPSWDGRLVLGNPALTRFSGRLSLTSVDAVEADGTIWWPVTITAHLRTLDFSTGRVIVEPDDSPGLRIGQRDVATTTWTGWLPQRSLVELGIDGVFPASMLGPQLTPVWAVTAGCQATTGAGSAHLRDAAGDSATVVASLASFANVDVLEGPVMVGASDWVRVTGGGLEGWVELASLVATGAPNHPALPTDVETSDVPACQEGRLRVGCPATNLTATDPGLLLASFGVLPVASFPSGATCLVAVRPAPNATTWGLNCAGTIGWVDADVLLPPAASEDGAPSDRGRTLVVSASRQLPLAGATAGSAADPARDMLARAVTGVSFTLFTDDACAGAPLTGPLDEPTGRATFSLEPGTGTVYLQAVEVGEGLVALDACQAIGVDTTYASALFIPRQPDLVATATANANATATANANATATANANATATARANATATANANATATARANATTTARANATATARANATATARANATATARANATATANTNATGTARASASQTALARANASATAAARTPTAAPPTATKLAATATRPAPTATP